MLISETQGKGGGLEPDVPTSCYFAPVAASALPFPTQAHSCVLAVMLTGRSLQEHVCAMLQQRGEERSPRSSLRFRPPTPTDGVDPKHESEALFPDAVPTAFL